MSTTLTRGLHPARCCQVIDLGTQAPFGRSTGKPQQKYWLSFEVLGFIAKEGKDFPATIGGEYGPYELRALAENWRSVALSAEQAEQFNPSVLLDVAGLATVIRYIKKDGAIALKLGSVSPMLPTLAADAMKSRPLHFDMSDGTIDKAGYEALPQFLRDKIAKSPQYKAIMSQNEQREPAYDYADADDNNMPF